MRKYITLFFSVTCILSACKPDKPREQVISHDRMISLLTDFHTLDGNMYNTAQLPDSLYKYGTARYLALFKKYHTDSVQFRKSLKYYTTQPVELQAMYDKVNENLTHQTDSLRKTLLKRKNVSPL